MHRLVQRIGAAFVCAVFALAVAPAPGQADSVTLTLPQTRDAARAALDQGKPRLAIKLARALVTANPDDPYPYFILAQAYRATNDPATARIAARFAFRTSRTDTDRFAAAQMAARLAYDEKRYLLSQYWLRRSLDPAPTEALRDQAIRDFKRLRAETPWTLRLRFSVAPSSNVNSGADSPYNIVDGVPVVGLLSGSAQALSGVEFTGDIAGSYRLAASRDAITRLDFRLYSRQVVLTGDAKRKAPGINGRDFASSLAEIGITHSLRLGQSAARPEGNGAARFSLKAGQVWYAQAPYYRFLRAEAERGFQLRGGDVLQISAALEHQDYNRRSWPANMAELRIGYSRDLSDTAKLTTGVILSRTDSKAGNTDNTRATAFVTFEPTRRLGPARLAFTIGASTLDYPQYNVGFAVPGGRQDDSLFGAVSLTFEEYDFAGFSPVLTLKGRDNRSNISRFDTRETTLSIGIRSNF